MAKVIEAPEAEEQVVISQKDIDALDRTTKKIKESLLSGKKAIYNIAIQLAKVEKNQMYVAGGYKSVTEYAEKELELKRATVNNYIRVANRFLETNNNGTFSSINLTDTAKELDAKSEYPITTLTELLVLDDTTIKQITDDGEIDSSMNQKQVRKVVAQYKPKKEKKEKETEESEESEESESNVERVVEVIVDEGLKSAIRNIVLIANENKDGTLIENIKVIADRFEIQI